MERQYPELQDIKCPCCEKLIFGTRIYGPFLGHRWQVTIFPDGISLDFDSEVMAIMVAVHTMIWAREGLMGIFVCDKCHALENTACGHYHCRNQNFFGEEHIGKAYCFSCMPTTYNDGSRSKAEGGKWHNRFPKEIMTKERVKEIGIENFVYVPKELQ